MKILYHHRIRSKDGQFVHIEELVRALGEMGHEVIVVGPSAVEKEEFGSDAGIVVTLKRRMPRFLYELLEFSYSLGDYLRLRGAARRHRPDALYERYNLFLPSGVWLKRRWSLPMLLEVNAPLMEERQRYDGLALKKLAGWTQRAAWRGADYVLVVTDALGEYVRRAGVPAERVVTIPNGVDPRRFARALPTPEAKRRLGLDGKLVIGFTGFVREWHGLEHVIDLLADPRSGTETHLLLVGDGPARAGLERRARGLGLEQRVSFTGVVDRGRVADHVAAFDIALQPRVVAYASPLKLFEYLALGRAVVAPGTPNIREILTDGEDALLFDPRDAEAFKSAVLRLCLDADLRERLGLAASTLITRRGLTWESNARRVVQLFSELGVATGTNGPAGHRGDAPASSSIG